MAAQFQYLDLTRVAINGWSYGGYLALRGIMDFPHVFKVKSFSEICSTLLFPFCDNFFGFVNQLTCIKNLSLFITPLSTNFDEFLVETTTESKWRQTN